MIDPSLRLVSGGDWVLIQFFPGSLVLKVMDQAFGLARKPKTEYYR